MKTPSYNLTNLKQSIRRLIYEALANRFGQGGDIKGAEGVANAQWGSVYNVMPKGEAKNEVFYRVQLHNSGGPVKYLKQDAQGRWFFMEPPNLTWRPVNPAKVPQTNEPLAENDEGKNFPGFDHIHWSIVDGKPLDSKMGSSASNGEKWCYDQHMVKIPIKRGDIFLMGRASDGKHYILDGPIDANEYKNRKTRSTNECDEIPDPMDGDTTDVHTMDTANLGEAVNYRASTDELVKAFVAWKQATPAEIKSHNAVAFTAGYNACLAAAKQTGLNESVNGKFQVYLTYLVRGDEKHRLFNSNANTKEEASVEAVAYMQSIAKANRIPPDSIKVLSVRKGGLNEETSSGAVFSGGPTIQTPNAFSKKGAGSKKAMDATKKTGYKPVKKEY